MRNNSDKTAMSEKMERDKRGRFLNYPGPGRRSKSGRFLGKNLGQELIGCFSCRFEELRDDFLQNEATAFLELGKNSDKTAITARAFNYDAFLSSFSPKT